MKLSCWELSVKAFFVLTLIVLQGPPVRPPDFDGEDGKRVVFVDFSE